MNQILAIDPEFEAKCPPLTEEEFQQLEENILGSFSCHSSSGTTPLSMGITGIESQWLIPA